MKQQVCALLCAALLAMGAGALAQTATYVFPYEGFRYTQREDETVLTQTNLSEHEELLKSLGTSSEAVLASYVASGLVMEDHPERRRADCCQRDGCGQICRCQRYGRADAGAAAVLPGAV